MDERCRQPVDVNNAETTNPARPRDEETAQALEAGGSFQVSQKRCAKQQDVDRPKITQISPAFATLERLTTFNARKMRRVERSEALIQVCTPQGLRVKVKKPCDLEFRAFNGQTIVGLAGAAENPHYLAEWETFTRTLLTVHRCIWCLSLLILDVPQPRGHFFWGLRLHNGCATIVIEVSALEDPWRDFMLPCLQYTCRLRNPQWTSLHYFDSLFPLPPLIAYRINAAVTQGAELLEFHDTRITRILESTMDMPSLRNIEIYLGNDNGGPAVPPEVSLKLTHRGYSERRKLMYEVDGGLQSVMNCESHDDSKVNVTVAKRAIPLPRLVTRRELTGSSLDLSRYVITLTHDASPYDYVINVVPMVRRQ